MEPIKTKLGRLKKKARDNAPVIAFGAYTAMAAAGWVIAGVYSLRLQKAEDELAHYKKADEEGWPSIIIPPKLMEEVMAGHVLKYREKKKAGGWVGQATTRDEFPDEANEEFDSF